MPVYRFGPFRLDTDGYRLTKDEATLTATPRQLDLLACLAADPSRLITRDELFERLWTGVAVTDNALTQLVSELRQTLGDSSGDPQYVQTVARRGYRFIAPVERVDAPAPVSPASPHGPGRRSAETSSLDVMKAVTDGRLQLEALDASQVEAAIQNFKRAIALDPAFAAGYVGLANAHFWQYEGSRFSFRPDAALLAVAIGEARQGLALAPDYAEAHATLAYLLAGSERPAEACAAARQAIALQPDYWGHHFRLGHAAWGQERLDALTRCLQLYPPFPFAYFEMAMVHVARQALDKARRALEEGIALQQRLGAARSRFPANGLHWMLGSVLLTRGDTAGALAEFAREGKDDRQALYAREYAVAALNTQGWARLEAGDVAQADAAFRASVQMHAEQVRPHLGLALVARRRRQAAAADAASAAARQSIERLRQGGRAVEASLMAAAENMVEDRHEHAVDMLESLLLQTEHGPAGWIVPIEPLFRPLAGSPRFRGVLRRLTERAA
jgi:DNA-binding winged helix-turn-helix (wHTH) protein/tetratricopeptide (TPR) repeat protein